MIARGGRPFLGQPRPPAGVDSGTMKQLFALALLGSLTSCTLHLHVHEAPKMPEGQEPAAASATPTTVCGSVAGIVVDEDGRPVRGRVAAVGAGGSYSTSVAEDGRFALQHMSWPDFVLHASTEDGRLAVRAHVVPGSDELALVVRPAAAVTIDFEGTESVRCAVFHEGDRIEDFTLHPKTPSRVVVPAGAVVVQLYSGDEVRAERTVEQAVGAQAKVSFGTL